MVLSSLVIIKLIFILIATVLKKHIKSDGSNYVCDCLQKEWQGRPKMDELWASCVDFDNRRIIKGTELHSQETVCKGQEAGLRDTTEARSTEALPSRSGTRDRHLLSLFSPKVIQEGLVRVIKQEKTKQNKDLQRRKEEMQLPLF